MGRDSYFYLCNRSSPCLRVKLACFRDYIELHDWIKKECKEIPGREGEFLVLYTDLFDLKNELHDIAVDLMALPHGALDQYDIWIKYEFDKFSPAHSKSRMPGTNLLRLYRHVLCFIDLLEEDEDDDLYIVFRDHY